MGNFDNFNPEAVNNYGFSYLLEALAFFVEEQVKGDQGYFSEIGAISESLVVRGANSAEIVKAFVKGLPANDPANPRNRDEDPYTEKPDVVRIFWEGNQFSIDGADNHGKHTDMCWSYDTLEEATKNVVPFVEAARVEGYEWDWDTPDFSDKLKGLSALQLLKLADAAKNAAKAIVVEEGKRQVAGEQKSE